MKQQSLCIIMLLLFSVLMLVPIQLVGAEHWVEVVRFEGRRDIFTTAPFVCNYSVWRIRYESYSGDRFPMIIPGVYTLNITIYRQGETTDYIDRISEEPTQGMYYYHLIRNNTGSFYMNISTGYSDSYSIIVEQNTDSVFVTPTPIPSSTPINSNTENNSASPQGLSLEIIAALVIMFVAAFAAVLLVLRRKSFRRNLMPKKLLTTTIILALAITMLSAIPMLKANFIPVHSEMDIYSPMPPFVSIYQNTSSVLLNFAVKVPADAPNHYPEIKNIYYCIDGKSAIEITNVKKYEKVPWFSGICMKYNASLLIDNLEDGNHTVLVYCQDDMGNKLSATRDFAVANSPISESSTPSHASIIPLVIGSLAVIVAVASVSLVYFRRRRGKL